MSNGRAMLKLPAGFAAAPISPAEEAAAVRICIVVRDKPQKKDGRLVHLRELVDGRVVLGCLADRAGQVHRWLEIFVQDLGGLAGATPVYRDAVTNAQMDERWTATARALEALDLGSSPAILSTGWERQHPPAMAIVSGRGQPLTDGSDAKRDLRLCRDEQALKQAGVPGYSTSLHRYLAPDGAAEPLVPVTADAPTSDKTRPLSAVLPADAVPFNTGGGLLMVRPRLPVSFEGMLNLLGGDPSSPGVRVGPFPESDSASGQEPLQVLGDEGFLCSRRHRWGRAAEVVHLKLRLLADAMASVQGLVGQLQRPLLNLSAESFRIELGAPGEGLPLLWTMRAALVNPGDAAALAIPGAMEQYFVRSSDAVSIYTPDSAGRAVQGRAGLRIRKVEAAGPAGSIIASGTLSTQERIRPAPSDLTWVRLHSGGQRVDLYARLERDASAPAEEWRFRSVPQRFDDAAKAGLQAAEGVPISDVPFQTVPLLSTPCDLYALGVLAARAMLVGEGNTLPQALDELFSLARNASGESEGTAAERIASAFRSDPRWGQALGPQYVAHGLGSVEEALDAVPLDLWCDILAAIVRMFPGIGPEPWAKDLGDAPAAGLQAVFAEPLAALRELVRRTRSLVVVDWSANREVHAVVRARRSGMSGATRPREKATA